MPVHALLNIAVRAARNAGEIIVRSMNRLESLQITSKGRNDFVTEIDQAAEAAIIAHIRKLYPKHAFLAEESGQTGESDTVWIIDPLDGTTNFLHGFPTFAVSIACQIRGVLEHAVVYDPMRQEIFTASRGQGAHLENHRMRELLRLHQHQLLQRHVLHGARHRPDVAGVRGLDEHDADGEGGHWREG